MKENTNMARYLKTMRDAMLEVSVKEKELLGITEKLEVSAGLGAWIDDFKKSDAPQFKGKSDEEKKNMAIAAFAGAGGKLKEGVDIDEANLPPHLAKFFDKKGNPKPEVAKRMSNAAKAKKAVVKDVTPKGYGPKEDLDAIHNEALKENESVLESIEWKVKLKGLPMFYVPAKNAGEVRSMLRRQIKKPDDIISIERSTKTAKKKDFRDRASEK
tara:strand:- start:128 stop:769 length:642 start_codon:yes stop_codon:yes gene_type:complete